jgi:hypothetical protein
VSGVPISSFIGSLRDNIRRMLLTLMLTQMGSRRKLVDSPGV